MQLCPPLTHMKVEDAIVISEAHMEELEKEIDEDVQLEEGCKHSPRR